MKRVLGDLIAKVGRESYLQTACEGHSIHNETNHNGKGVVNFALGTFKDRIKSHLPFEGIIRSSPYSPRFQIKG